MLFNKQQCLVKLAWLLPLWVHACKPVFRVGTLAKNVSSLLNSSLYQTLSQGFKFHFQIQFLVLKWDLSGALT